MLTDEPHFHVHLPNNPRSFALLSAMSEDCVRRAVVFVHGFNGSASTTWTDFLTLVDVEEVAGAWWSESDLYFYDYRWASVFQQININSLSLFIFLTSLFPNPSKLLRASMFRLNPFVYNELVLVAHSEGGLLLRKVMLEAAQDDHRVGAFLRKGRFRRRPEPEPFGLLLGKLRLFAPALGGEMQSGYLGIVSSLPIVSNLLRVSAARNSMNPASASVTETRKQTDEYAARLDMACFRADILWAEKDLVVNGEKYASDMQCKYFPPATTHISVCKPTMNYTLPLRFVEKGVNCV
jgi:hypothetical protein